MPPWRRLERNSEKKRRRKVKGGAVLVGALKLAQGANKQQLKVCASFPRIAVSWVHVSLSLSQPLQGGLLYTVSFFFLPLFIPSCCCSMRARAPLSLSNFPKLKWRRIINCHRRRRRRRRRRRPSQGQIEFCRKTQSRALHGHFIYCSILDQLVQKHDREESKKK